MFGCFPENAALVPHQFIPHFSTLRRQDTKLAVMRSCLNGKGCGKTQIAFITQGSCNHPNCFEVVSLSQARGTRGTQEYTGILSDSLCPCHGLYHIEKKQVQLRPKIKILSRSQVSDLLQKPGN